MENGEIAAPTTISLFPLLNDSTKHFLVQILSLRPLQFQSLTSIQYLYKTRWGTWPRFTLESFLRAPEQFVVHKDGVMLNPFYKREPLDVDKTWTDSQVEQYIHRLLVESQKEVPLDDLYPLWQSSYKSLLPRFPHELVVLCQDSLSLQIVRRIDSQQQVVTWIQRSKFD